MASCNRARRGLFAGKVPTFINRISFSQRKYAHAILRAGSGPHGGRALLRTRAKQSPNVQPSSFFSFALNRFLKFPATTHAKYLIDKAGGIDNWLLRTANAEINNPKAVALKRRISRLRNATRPPREPPQAAVE